MIIKTSNTNNDITTYDNNKSNTTFTNFVNSFVVYGHCVLREDSTE